MTTLEGVQAKSPVVAAETGQDEPGYSFTEEEQLQYGAITKRIVRSRNEREQARDEFDGLSYTQNYRANKRAAMSFLTPKKNKNEVRISTGTTEKKIEIVLSELLAMNLTGEIRVFDRDDNLMRDLGISLSDIVQRTNQMENYEEKRREIYTELLTQPSVFVEEIQAKQPNGMMMCEKHLVMGTQMFLGDMNLSHTKWNKQPYLVKYWRGSHAEAKLLFEDLNPDKFKLVNKGGYGSKLTGMGLSPGSDLYRANSLEDEEVEAFIYMSYPDDEVQILVNGIPMLDVGEKYTKHFGDFGTYHITMVPLKVLSGDFAMGKSLQQSAKTLQALDNEIIRNMVRKFRQAIEPPIASRVKFASRDIWSAGKINHGIKASDFEKLTDHQGVTQSEFAFYDLIEKKTNEFIGAMQETPLQGKSKTTATEFLLAQKQAIKLLGNAVLAATILEQRLTFLRAKNALLMYTKPVRRKLDPIQRKINDVFQRFTIDDADLEGTRGTRVIQLMDRSLTPEEKQAVFQVERRSDKVGKPVRYKFVNMRAVAGLDMYLYPTAVSKPKDSSELDKAMFGDMMIQASDVMKVTGARPKPARVVAEFERVWRVRDFFEKGSTALEQELKNMVIRQDGSKESPEVQSIRGLTRTGEGPVQAANAAT